MFRWIPTIPKNVCRPSLKMRRRRCCDEEDLVEVLPKSSAQLICLDKDWSAIAAESAAKVEAKLDRTIWRMSCLPLVPREGRGVAIEHGSASAFIHWARSVSSPADLAGVLFSTSVCFDLSVFELFVTLSAGGKVVIAQDALRLPDLPAAEQVTLINTVPSAMTELLRMAGVPRAVCGEPGR